MLAAAFLDRDGTLIEERGFISSADQVRLEVGVVTGLRKLSALGFQLVVVSNQSGVGRGFLTLEQAMAVNRRTCELLAEQGISICGWFMCPHLPTEGCRCRKPSAGMALAASEKFGLDLTRSLVIGDKRSDMELAKAIGGLGILVETGYGRSARDWAVSQGLPVCSSIDAAADFVLGGSP